MQKNRAMAENINFIVYGEPQGKGRPRFSRRGAFVSTYTPEKTATYENLVKMSFLQKYQEPALIDEPVIVGIKAYFGIPKSVSTKKREKMMQGKIVPTKKPDMDNIAKIILDSLNGLAYLDDKQVVLLTVWKRFSEVPRVEVNIGLINDIYEEEADEND